MFSQIKRVEQLLSWIPAEVISRRAVECKSYSRALFHWEQYIRQRRTQAKDNEHPNLEPLYERLQDIYTQIDEPDGIEGISAHLHVLNIEQQVVEHRKAGRWVAAQSWYELQLNKDPEDSDVQVNLLTCLKESGQHGMALAIPIGFVTILTILRCPPQSVWRSKGLKNYPTKNVTFCSGGLMGYQ